MIQSFYGLVAAICEITIIKEVAMLIIPSNKNFDFLSAALSLISSFVIVQKIVELIKSII